MIKIPVAWKCRYKGLRNYYIFIAAWPNKKKIENLVFALGQWRDWYICFKIDKLY